MSLDDAVSLARKYRVSGVELRTLEGVVDLPILFKERYGSPERMAQQLSLFEISIFSLDTSFKLVGNTEAERTTFLAYVPWAEALAIPRLRVFDGGKSGSEEELREAAETARWWAAMRRERGWRTDLMIETHDAFITTPLIKSLVSHVPDCALLWDSHHTWRKGGEDPVSTWSEIKNHVCHLHVKDSQSTPSARHAYTYVLPGTGEFPIKPLAKQLLHDRYDGPISLEWERLWHPYLPPLEDALKAADVAEGWK